MDAHLSTRSDTRTHDVSSVLHTPMSGTDSDVAGTSSAISSMNMEKARNTDSPRLIFSPAKVEHEKGKSLLVIRVALSFLFRLNASEDHSNKLE